MNPGWGSYRVQTMHSPQASKFALYRAQPLNRGKYRGKVLAFVTSQIRDSEGYILLIRRECIGYVVYPTLCPMHALRAPRRYSAQKYPVKPEPYGVSSGTTGSQSFAYAPCMNVAHLYAETFQLSIFSNDSSGECMPSSSLRTSCADALAIDSTSDSV